MSFTLQPLIAHHPKCASEARFGVSAASALEVPVAWGIGLPLGAGGPCLGRTWERGT